MVLLKYGNIEHAARRVFAIGAATLAGCFPPPPHHDGFVNRYKSVRVSALKTKGYCSDTLYFYLSRKSLQGKPKTAEK